MSPEISEPQPERAALHAPDEPAGEREEERDDEVGPAFHAAYRRTRRAQMTATTATITTTTVASQATMPIDELQQQPAHDQQDDDRERSR